MASLQGRPLNHSGFLFALLALTSAVLQCQAQFGPNGTFSQAGTTKTYPVAGPFGFVDFISSNYTAIKVDQSYARTLCRTGKPAYPVVEATIAGVHQAMLAGNLTCSQLVAAYKQRIAFYDQSSGVNSIRLLAPDLDSVTAAKDAQLAAVLASGNRTLPDLFCVPLLIKDNYDTVGIATANGAVALLDNFPSQDATIVAQLKAAGALVLAKANMAEWAYTSQVSIGSVFGIVRNPYDLDRSTAGSSGGTAASVAASFGMIGLGSDTGNSIRGPSGHQALVGIRSTIGMTSRAGIVPLFLNRDIGGPMGRTVADVARVFQHIVGPDPSPGSSRDTVTLQSANTTLNPYGIPTNYTQFLIANGLKNKTIGVLRGAITNPTQRPDQEIVNLFNRAVTDMQSLGAKIVENFTVPGNSLGDVPWDGRNGIYIGYGTNGSWQSYQNSQCALWAEDLNAYLQTAGTKLKSANEIFINGGFHPSVLATMTNYLRVQNISSKSLPSAADLARSYPCGCGDEYTNVCRIELRKNLVAAMDAQGVDAIVYPGWNNPARLIGDYDTPLGDNSQNVCPPTGMPGITVPMGFTSRGLPASLQIAGRPYAESTLFTVAYAYEQGTMRRKAPPAFPECIANTTSSVVSSDLARRKLLVELAGASAGFSVQ